LGLGISKLISLTTIESLHLSLESLLSAHYTTPFLCHATDPLPELLSPTYEAFVTPSLRRIYTDISFNTISIVAPSTVTLLKEREEEMRVRGIEVLIVRKKCIGGTQEYVPLIKETQAISFGTLHCSRKIETNGKSFLWLLAVIVQWDRMYGLLGPSANREL
jgi:hypothetical protein